MTPMEATAKELTDALEQVTARIAQAAQGAGRSGDEVTLVAISKSFPTEVLRAAVEAGVGDLGENRAQELREKAAALGDAVRWHFVGPLQKNKVRIVVGTAALIHSVESLPLAEAIARRAETLRIVQQVLIEVNLSGEAKKHGVEPHAAIELAQAAAALDHISVAGLMTMAPFSEDAENSRPYFRKLASLRDELARVVPDATGLSMGMSRDFEVGVEEGATLVRVGEAIFGSRKQ